MQITIGSVLKVSVKNTYIRNGLFYYQRAIPRDLLDKYPAKRIKINLGIPADDPVRAAREVERLDDKHEAEWDSLRTDPSTSPQAARQQAKRLLSQHGIDPRVRAH